MKIPALKKILFTLPFAAGMSIAIGGSASAVVTTQCPSISYAQGCNDLITLNPGGTVTITFPNSTPYDDVEDQLVGVQNNTGGSVSAITLSGANIFGLDHDGARSPLPTGNGVIGPYGVYSSTTPFDPGDYEGPTDTFTIVDKSDGTVNFTGGLANGGSAWFSLEKPPSVGGFSVTGITPGGGKVPEPRTLLLAGSGLTMLFFGVRLRKRA